jgi:hypothetical protein
VAYTINLNGYTLSAGSAPLMITPTDGAVTFDFDNNASKAVFSSSSGWTQHLDITNYLSGSSVLSFGTSSSGLSLQDLGQIDFVGYSDGGAAQIDSSGFVTPVGSAVPEPGNYAL